MFHLFASIAEFEHEIICERTRAGLDAARVRGRKGSWRPTEMMQATARQMYNLHHYTIE